MTERVRPNTPRWARRLAVAILISSGLHFGPFAAARRFLRTEPLRLEYRINSAVEIGLEHAQSGAHNPPPAGTPPDLTTSARPAASPTTPATSPATPAVNTPAPVRRVVVHRAPPATPRTELPPLPEPRVQLHEPDMAMAHRRPRLVQPDEDLHQPQETPPAPTNSAPSGLPSIASVAGDLAPAVPRGSLLTILVRSDRIRSNPNAPAVRRLLGSIPDWDAMIGGTNLDPVEDLDTILLASAQPFRGEGRVPDWFAITRAAHGNTAALRRAIERMSDEPPPAPSPITFRGEDAGLDGGEGADNEAAGSESEGQPLAATLPDGGRRRSIWQREPGGAEVATINRYGARRSFVLMGNGVAAIALPGQVNALLAAMARRGSPLGASEGDPRLIVLLESEGTRNLFSYRTARGDFPVPRRLSLALFEARDEGGQATGAAHLDMRWQYDSAEQARHGVEMVEYERGVWRAEIERRAGRQGGLNRFLSNMVASMVGIDLNGLEGALTALQVRAEGDRVVVSADWSAGQVRALLNGAAMAGE